MVRANVGSAVVMQGRFLAGIHPNGMCCAPPRRVRICERGPGVGLDDPGPAVGEPGHPGRRGGRDHAQERVPPPTGCGRPYRLWCGEPARPVCDKDPPATAALNRTPCPCPSPAVPGPGLYSMTSAAAGRRPPGDPGPGTGRRTSPGRRAGSGCDGPSASGTPRTRWWSAPAPAPRPGRPGTGCPRPSPAAEPASGAGQRASPHSRLITSVSRAPGWPTAPRMSCSWLATSITAGQTLNAATISSNCGALSAQPARVCVMGLPRNLST